MLEWSESNLWSERIRKIETSYKLANRTKHDT